MNASKIVLVHGVEMINMMIVLYVMERDALPARILDGLKLWERVWSTLMYYQGSDTILTSTPDLHSDLGRKG